MPDLDIQEVAPAEDSSGRRLRLALILGLGGIALIFLIAAMDSVRLLRAMRTENQALRAGSLERTRQLTSVRAFVLESQAYQSDPEKIRDASTHISYALAGYRCASPEEQAMMKHLNDLLDRHWLRLTRAVNPNNAAFYQEQIVPVRASIVEISTQIEGLDGKQEAAAQTEMENEFERLGAQLSSALGFGLAAALLLSAGCALYIFRIERQNRRRYLEVVDAHGALERLSGRLVEAQETERRTISRDLHDQVGQTLNAVLVEAANLAKRIQPGDTVSLQYLDNIRKFTDTSVNSIRDISLLLRPSMLDDLGVISALEWQAREVSRRSGIKVTVNADNVSESLPDDIRTCVYRVVQEALNNVSRHSGAKRATVTLRQNGNKLSLCVEDDGSGFDPAKTRGLGMLGMEERVRQLKGSFEIHSSKGEGTQLRVALPLSTE